VLELEQAQPLVDWINERHAIYMRKAILEDQAAQGLQYPALSNTGRLAWGKGGWTLDRLTEDPILREYRFCNVFRELDRVTVWIRENIREPFADNEHLWYMLAIARFINWPPTLERLIESPDGWPFDPRFSPERMTMVLEEWKSRGEKVETGAYMIRAESDTKKEWYSWSKQRYVSEIVLGRMWEQREEIARRLELDMTLEMAFRMFREMPGAVGWGPFMTHQVIVDLRWTRYLRDAPDVGRWASLGPGSIRGLNRLHGRPLKGSLSQERGLEEMLELQELVHRPGVLKPWVPAIELADIQNCLCETDKWLRAKQGEGRPRSQYVPGRGS
jgi:hypothetical protein